MRRILLFSIASALAFGWLPAEAADVPWTYDSSARETTAPATAEGTMHGLDARPRGLDDSMSITVDKWFWSSVWTIREVSFRLTGTLLIFR